MQRRAILTVLLVLSPIDVSAQSHPANDSGKQLSTSPRDSKGQLQRFDCSFVLEPGGHRHFCDPVEFGTAIRATKTVAITQGNVPPGEDGTELLRLAEKLIRGWGRFRVISDFGSADLVFQFDKFTNAVYWNKITQRTEWRDTPLPGCDIMIWPHGANPERDDLLWQVHYWPKWPQSDLEAWSVCVERLHKDIQDAEKSEEK